MIRPPEDRFRVWRRLAVGVTTVAALALAPVAASAQSLIRDAEIEATLRADSEPIFRAAGLNPADVKINIVNDAELNAFVAGGQQVFLNTGMILATENPDQLRGVIAHEAGHIAGGHIARSGDAMRAGIQPLILTLALGALAAFAGRPDAGAAILSSSNYFATLSVLSYSRVQESAADQAALGYLQTAGYSGRGLADFFRQYQFQEVFSQARRYSYFQSHPISSERVAALRTRVDAASNRDRTPSAESVERHTVMKAKLDAFLRPPGHTFVRYPESDTRFAARYARAIAYFRDAQPDRSITMIDALIAEHPDNPYLWELKGQINFESGRIAASEAPYRRAVALAPENPLLRVGLAQTLVALGPTKFDDAIANLQHSLARERDNPLGWRLLGQAYDGKNMPGLARLAAAEEHFHGNDLRGAFTFATRARALLAAGTPDHRRATDIVMASEPTQRELREMAREERVGG